MPPPLNPRRAASAFAIGVVFGLVPTACVAAVVHWVVHAAGFAAAGPTTVVSVLLLCGAGAACVVVDRGLDEADPPADRPPGGAAVEPTAPRPAFNWPKFPTARLPFTIPRPPFDWPFRRPPAVASGGVQDRDASIGGFLSATAAKQPTPGGGSVAALAGALSAAIGEMVLSYSVGRKDSAAVDPQLRRAAAELGRAREVLLRLMVDDQEAYAALTAARKLPADAADRAERLPAAVLACVRGPQAIAATAVAVLGLCEQVVDVVNPWLLSDLAVCADLATATVRCAGYNVRVNLPSVADAGERQRLAAETEQVWAHALAAVQRVSPRIWARAGR